MSFISFVVGGRYHIGSYYTDTNPPRITNTFKRGVVDRMDYIVVEPLQDDIKKYSNHRVSLMVNDVYIPVIITSVIGMLLDGFDRHIPILEINKPELLRGYEVLQSKHVIKHEIPVDKDDNVELIKGFHPLTEEPGKRLSIPKKIIFPPKSTTPPSAPTTDTSCSVCLDKPRTLAFGCGHIVCVTCGPQLTICPMCRAPVTSRIKLFV